MNNQSELKNQQLLVKDSGQMQLDTVIPKGSELKFVDFSSVSVLAADHTEYTLNVSTKNRFSPGSHVGFEYKASDFKNSQGKSLQGNFIVAVSVSLSNDGRTLMTAIDTQPPVDQQQLRPNGLMLNFYFDQPTISASIGASLPQYAVRDTVRAARIESLQQDPQNPNSMIAITNPAIENLRLSSRFGALGKGKTAQPTTESVSQSSLQRNPADGAAPRPGQAHERQAGQGNDRIDQQSLSGQNQNQVLGDNGTRRTSALVRIEDGSFEVSGASVAPGDYVTLESDGTMNLVPANQFNQHYQAIGGQTV